MASMTLIEDAIYLTPLIPLSFKVKGEGEINNTREM
jgi:hypothetical protein